LAPLTAFGRPLDFDLGKVKEEHERASERKINTMHHPYQCLAVARKHSGDIMVAAVGPHILVFSIKNKELLSSWPEKEIAKVHNTNFI